MENWKEFLMNFIPGRDIYLNFYSIMHFLFLGN